MHKQALNNKGDVLDPPKTWSRFLKLADAQRSASTFVIAVDQPEQNTLVFESLLLGLAGPGIYKSVFQDFDYKTLRGDEMIDVFTRFSELRPFLANPQYQTWSEGALALKQGHGSVLFAGDWVKPFFNEPDGDLSTDILCEPYPEAPATFLFNLNSVVMFKDTLTDDAEALADLLFSETLLTELNLTEGSIPARLDVSPYGFDRCGVRSMREFRSAHSIQTLNPSLAAGMAAPEHVQREVYKAINLFIDDATMSPEEGAKVLAKAIRVALYRI